MPELVINPSNIISALCYSVLRYEPYTTCSFSCIYCYARWYRESADKDPRPRFKALGMFRDLVRKTYKLSLDPYPIRISTLIEPLQEIEKIHRLTLRALELAYEFGYPVIVNTKSDLIIQSPWVDIILKLAERGLVVVQISISSFDEKCSKILEPGAPTPIRRLNVLELLGASDVPLVVRLQPYIPGITCQDIDATIEMLKSLKVRHIIVESLRLTEEEYKHIFQLLGTSYDLEPYHIREQPRLRPVLRPSLHIRMSEYRKIMETAMRYGITFATCKEGLFNLHTSPDCCGMFLLRSRYVIRPTLSEIYGCVRDACKLLDGIYGKICSRNPYVCGDELRKYPSIIRKGLLSHERKLLKVLRSNDILKKITPLLMVDQGLLCTTDLLANTKNTWP